MGGDPDFGFEKILFGMIFVTGKSVTVEDFTSFRGNDSVAGEFLRYESKPVYRENAHGVITFAHSTTQKILKEQGLHENPELFIPGRKEILYLLRRSSKSGCIVFSYMVQ